MPKKEKTYSLSTSISHQLYGGNEYENTTVGIEGAESFEQAKKEIDGYVKKIKEWILESGRTVRPMSDKQRMFMVSLLKGLGYGGYENMKKLLKKQFNVKTKRVGTKEIFDINFDKATIIISALKSGQVKERELIDTTDPDAQPF